MESNDHAFKVNLLEDILRCVSTCPHCSNCSKLATQYFNDIVRDEVVENTKEIKD